MDTGSSLTLVNINIVPKSAKIIPIKTRLIAAGEHKINIIGKTKIKIHISINKEIIAKCWVCSKLINSAIVERDIIK